MFLQPSFLNFFFSPGDDPLGFKHVAITKTVIISIMKHSYSAALVEHAELTEHNGMPSVT